MKTRIGWRDPAEFGPLLALLSRYPMAELTVHPRVREEFYRGGAHLEAFQQAVEIWRGPLCYNGDLTAPGEVSALTERFPGLEDVLMQMDGILTDQEMAALNYQVEVEGLDEQDVARDFLIQKGLLEA